MSIIHEALKKTEQSVNQKTRITPVGHQKAGSWRPFVFFAIFLAVTVPFFAGQISNHGKSETGASRSLAQFGVEETPTTPPMLFASRPSHNINRIPFVLSGVVYSGPESYCLINGLVLKQGQKVAGATVESITPDKVTLDFGGEKIALLVTTN